MPEGHFQAVIKLLHPPGEAGGSFDALRSNPAYKEWDDASLQHLIDLRTPMPKPQPRKHITDTQVSVVAVVLPLSYDYYIALTSLF